MPIKFLHAQIQHIAGILIFGKQLIFITSIYSVLKLNTESSTQRQDLSTALCHLLLSSQTKTHGHQRHLCAQWDIPNKIRPKSACLHKDSLSSF